MIKRIIYIVFLFVIILSFDASAFDTVNNYIDDALNEIPNDIFDITEFKNDIINEGKIPTAKDAFSYVLNVLCDETLKAFKSLSVLVCPILLMGVIGNISLKNQGPLETANTLAYFLIAGTVIYVFADATKLSKETIDNIGVMSDCMIPVMYSLMLTVGKITGYTVMQPTVIFGASILMSIIKKVIFPLIMFSFALNITDNISGRERFKKLSDLTTKFSKWSLIFMITLFAAILSAQNILAHSFDSVAMKGAKFMVANFIPVIGGAISEGAQTIGSSLLLIKNATGIAGIVSVCVAAFIPVVKIYLISFMFFVLSSVSQAVSGDRIMKVLTSSAETVSMLAATVLSVSFLFIVSVAVTLGG